MELRVTGGDLSTTVLDHEPQPEQPSGGWPLVLALAVAQLVSWGTVYYSFSLLILPMEAELGWTRTGINGALSFGLLIAGLSAYGAGSWIERHGGRWLMTVGTVLASLMLAAWSQVHTLTAMYLIWAGLGVAMAATLYEPVFVVLTRSFPQSFRLRITVLTLVAGFASTIFMPLTEILVQSQGWRGALLILAAINLAMCLPIHALWLRDNANRDRPTPPPIDRKALLGRALRNPVFWGLALCLMAYNATFSALTFHLIPLLAERGVETAVAIAAVALIGPSQVAGRLLIFLFARRLPTALTGRIVLLALPVSLVLLIRFPDFDIGAVPGRDLLRQRQRHHDDHPQRGSARSDVARQLWLDQRDAGLPRHGGTGALAAGRGPDLVADRRLRRGTLDAAGYVHRRGDGLLGRRRPGPVAGRLPVPKICLQGADFLGNCLPGLPVI